MTTPQELTRPSPTPSPVLSSVPQTTVVAAGAAARALMQGLEGRTARLTLISVLLGAMVGAIVAALPPSPAAFATSVLNGERLLLDLQVVAMLLLVFIVWLEFSWVVLLGLTAYDLLGNFVLFLTAITVIGLALSMRDIAAWLAWEVAVAAAIGVNFLTTRFVRQIRTPWWRWALVVAYLVSSAYAATAAYGLLPTWTTLTASSLVWVIVFIMLGVAELLAFMAFLHSAGSSAASNAT
jgi:hypothetical protein